MLERLKKALPPYFVEKFDGVDEQQVNALPNQLRTDFVHGSKKEANKAMKDLHAMERLRGKILLGEAGLELIAEMRHVAQNSG